MYRNDIIYQLTLIFAAGTTITDPSAANENLLAVCIGGGLISALWSLTKSRKNNEDRVNASIYAVIAISSGVLIGYVLAEPATAFVKKWVEVASPKPAGLLFSLAGFFITENIFNGKFITLLRAIPGPWKKES